MTYKCFKLTIADNIAHIQLNRPEKRNAMIKEFWSELPEAVKKIDDEALARVIVISSTGPIFSAGIDISMLSSVGGSPDKNRATYGAEFYTTVKGLQESFTTLENCRIPVLAAIQGGCIGAGLDLITACDMRYGTDDSYITIYEINVGMTADVGTFPRILNHLPEGIVRELAYTGRKMGAAECVSRGLYNGVYPTQEAMMDGVMQTAKTIASKPPLAVYGCKHMITYGRDHSTQDALDYVGVWNMSMLLPSEMMEAMQSMGQKRVGKFADLPSKTPKK
ncbi:MAG: enoyl-CoA hydratase-related protein [Maricaulaceae bacterium]